MIAYEILALLVLLESDWLAASNGIIAHITQGMLSAYCPHNVT